MATVASDELERCADQLVHQCGYASAVLSGMVPDPAHLEGGGFHCSIQDLIANGNGGDYSNVRLLDRGFNTLYCAAIDFSLNPADMKKAYGRVYPVWADKADPRRQYVNAINGWDGSGDAVRLDFDAGTASYASPDHQWHNHVEIHRKFVRDMAAMAAVVSIYKGESKAQWIASGGRAATEGDDVSWEEDVITNPAWRADAATNKTVKAGFALYDAWQQAHTAMVKATSADQKLDQVLALLKAMTGRDFTDEPAIVQGVLAALNPTVIAAAIPKDMARQVADELAARLKA